MANYPSSLDTTGTLPNPTDDSFTTSPSHGQLHRDYNAILISLEGKVGVTNSTDVTSLENRASNHAHTAASATDGGTVSHAELGTVTADQHHTKAHVHTVADGSSQIPHTNLTSVGANDHHAQVHAYSSHTGLPSTSDPTAHGILSAFHTGVDTADTPANLDVLTWDAGNSRWTASAPTGGGTGAPIGVAYLVTTADATLTNEVVVGTAPQGELGGTWAAPTIDATHSGSAHHTQLHTMTDTLHHTGAISAAQHPSMATDVHTNYVFDQWVAFSQDGLLPTAGKTGKHRMYVRGNWTIVAVRASVGTAPAGVPAVFDVRIVGASIWAVTPSIRPSIPVNQFTAEVVTFDDATIDNGQYFTADVVAPAGTWTTVPQDLVVQVFLVRR